MQISSVLEDVGCTEHSGLLVQDTGLSQLLGWGALPLQGPRCSGSKCTATSGWAFNKYPSYYCDVDLLVDGFFPVVLNITGWT